MWSLVKKGSIRSVIAGSSHSTGGLWADVLVVFLGKKASFGVEFHIFFDTLLRWV